ncbi:unnamed protein product [Paramecium octaurelia]|uniref:Uncharacterized protein n=1 Tax=Paramecium octaurelia TaxID=43137 RepID=A0A8S1WR94_PAROT|nr:unnamed protein product [Paramecium octaurelia]
MKNFATNPKNIGGMKMLNDNMFLHHKALIDAKPAIKIKPPRPHVNNIKKVDPQKPKEIDLPMYKNKQEFDQVMKTFQTVIGMKKGRINSDAPITMEFRRNISGNATKKEKFERDQHILNLQSQYRRIASAGSMQERKKNSNDPIAHPPRFFRREGETMANIKIDKLLHHFTKEQRMLEETPNSELSQKIEELNKKKVQLSKPKQPRAQSAKLPTQKSESSSRIKTRNADDITTEVKDIPKVSTSSEEDLEKLRQMLIRIIFHHKIFKTQDLETLFARVLNQNPQIDLIRAEILFEMIREQLKSQ